MPEIILKQHAENPIASPSLPGHQRKDKGKGKRKEKPTKTTTGKNTTTGTPTIPEETQTQVETKGTENDPKKTKQRNVETTKNNKKRTNEEKDALKNSSCGKRETTEPRTQPQARRPSKRT